ncbi:hypothetical protein E2C01_098612 [Portunus trituberculatus]|uniref:Uncharacterized protein n=1 Tax=Portunus trituberculatus TaxID=210409 RepID=A0A5B7KDC8_PORTR|nr:hypothetical protein [Portunus trituberculatus]
MSEGSQRSANAVVSVRVVKSARGVREGLEGGRGVVAPHSGIVEGWPHVTESDQPNLPRRYRERRLPVVA